MKQQKSFEQLCQDLKEIYEYFADLKTADIHEFDAKKTAHIAVDMINGFVKFGALASDNVLEINQSVADFASECQEYGIRNMALCDSHPRECTEFETYPVHCLAGSPEAELTEELKKAADFEIFPKLSVNGYLEKAFSDRIKNSDFNTFIITGDCTDMCVIQLALTLKSAMNQINRAARVIIPYELTATCTLPMHEPEISELAALFVMKSNGIEIIKNIQ